jgi:dipeptidyl aminopeptidase/acylaminoacyl peptidase
MTAQHPFDVDTLWQLHRVGGIALSPDGKRAVCSVSEADMADNRTRSSLWLLSTEGGAPRRLTTCGDRDGQPAWCPSGQRVAFVSRRDQQGDKDTSPQLYVIDAGGGEARRISHFAPGVESFKWMPDGRHIVFAAWVWPALKGAAAQNRQQKAFDARKESGYATSEAFYRYWDHEVPQGRAQHLMLLDVQTGRVQDLFEGTTIELPRDSDSASLYDVHPSGRHIAFAHDPAPVPQAGNRFVITQMSLGRSRSSRFARLLDDPRWDFGAPCYSPDGDQLAATGAEVGRAHTAFSQIVLLALAQRAGKRRPRWQARGADWDHDVDGNLQWARDGAALYFTAEQRGRVHLWRHELAGGGFEVAHAGGTVHDFGVAADVLLVAADSARHPTRLLALRDGQPPARIENFNDAILGRVALGEVREVEVRGAGGEPVQMWLTFPPGLDPDARRPARHAVTHLIHGGPYAAAGDTFGYRWNPHVFAAAGHVVAQVNFHGSSGFGWAFRHSLIGRQGELELQDIEAGTDWLLQQPWADNRRVFATGGSYGGFLVAWMNGHVPAGRYQAYVCHAGVFDRFATFSADSYPVRPKDLAANWWEDPQRVLAQSPHTFAAHMNTPTLVIHGARDYRVPDCNGLAYYNTLKARGVEARLLWFPDENHWVLKPCNSRLWYREFLAWLDAHGAAGKRGKPAAAGSLRKATQ